jgi:hypothetical protein
MDEDGMRYVMGQFSEKLKDNLEVASESLSSDIKDLVEAQHASNITRLVAAHIKAEHSDPVGRAADDYKRVVRILLEDWTND